MRYPARVGLPIVPEDPCRGCASDCCREHAVPLGALDLLALSDGLGEPWSAIAELESERTPLGGGFRLDRSTVHYRFVLRRTDEGACRFLDAQPGGGRCAIHPLRPPNCRGYPFVADEGGIAFGMHAVCPAERGEAWRALPEPQRAPVQAVERSRAVEAALRDRWDELARAIPVERPLAPADYLAFAARARPLLDGAESADEAATRIAALPLR